MKRVLFAALAASLGLLGAAPALAHPLPDGGVTVEEVADVMRAKGLPTKIGTDKAGSPMIESSLEGVRWGIYFYHCKGAPVRCKSLQLSAGIDMREGLTYARINQWNAEHRYGQGFLDDEMDPFIQQDLDLARGGTTEAVDNLLDVWLIVLPGFLGFIHEES